MERAFRKTSYGKISYLYRPGEYPLIFLHGLGGSSNNWTRLTKHLDMQFSLYFLDLLGHGRTEATDWNFKIKDQCAMIEELVYADGIENFSLAGNSYGGWIASTYAASFGKPKYLILEDSAGLNPTMEEAAGPLVERFIDRLQDFGRENNREIMRKIIEQNSKEEEKLTPDMLSAISSGTLVIWGGRDHMIDISYGRELNIMIPGSKFAEIEEAGHVPHYTHAEVVGNLINNFCIF